MTRFAPKMEWTKGGMGPVDRYLKFHVVKAPIDRVLPLCVGVLRATNGGAVLTRGLTEPPYSRHERLRKGKASYFSMLPGFLISSPAGRPDHTLIECPPVESLHRALALMAPELDLIAIESAFETASRQIHQFNVWRGGARVRLARVEKGYESCGWLWREDGAPEAYEDRDAYALKRIGGRVTRPMLLGYAREWGVEPERHLFDRALENTVLIEAGTVWRAEDDRPRTREFEAEYRRALSLGIGEPEPEDGGEGQRRMWEDANARLEWRGRAARAFNRLRTKAGATAEDAATLYDTFERQLLEEVGLEADPHPLDAWAANAAAELGAAHPAAERLRRNAARWSAMRELGFRLQRLLRDDAEKWPPEAVLDGLRRRALREADETGEAAAAILPRLFLTFCAETGTPVDPAAAPPLTAKAMAAGFVEIVADAQAFSNRINAGPTADISAGPIRAKDKP